MYRIFFIVLLITACQPARKMHWPENSRFLLTGSSFYQQAAAWQWQQRDSLAVKNILAGDVPSFLRKFTPVHVMLADSNGRKIKATYYVAPDYLSIGSNDDWARVPLTPMAAQKIADSLGCFLPTRKMVNDIYKAAVVKLTPVPMYAFRDSTVTMWQHHLIIEGQRKGRKGLVAGIKKDVVISSKITGDPKSNRVAIYGWHMPGGKPIQPLYTGHVNWYVDYSHGIRLVYHNIKVNGRWMNYRLLLSNPALKPLLCDEDDCGFTAYPY